jgi:hypothetical protein
MFPYWRRKPLLLALALCLVSGVILVEAFGAYHYAAHHHYGGRHVHNEAESGCPACLGLEAARNALKGLGFFAAAVLCFPRDSAYGRLKNAPFSRRSMLSPIILKVKSST